MPAEMHIEVPRNGHYSLRWRLTDKKTGTPLDLTGWGLALEARSAAGVPGTPIASASISNRDNLDGSFDVTFVGSDFDEVEGPMQIVRLAYDFAATDGGGLTVIETRGALFLMPGVTGI